MLSTKLVQLIEENWEEIASRLIVAIRKHPDMKNLARLPDVDLKEWCQQVLENLGHLLTATNEEEVERRYRIFGKLRFEENIPLHEAVLRFHILNDKVIGFIHEQGFTMNALELYAEEELEHRMGRYFDACVYHIVRGYEEALRRATRLAS
jgi:hypothetical protein